MKRNSTIDPGLVSNGSNACSHQFCTLIEGHDSIHADVSGSGFVFEILTPEEKEPDSPEDGQLELELDF